MSGGLTRLPSLLVKSHQVVVALLVLLWEAGTRRSFTYSSYCLLAARELEERYLSPTVRTLSRGGTLSQGGQVRLAFDPAPQAVTMGRLARRLSVRQVATWTSRMFLLLDLALFVQAVVVRG